MGDFSTLPSPIQQALTRGWTVLTANQRAARVLHRDFDISQRVMALSQWELPAIFSWESWINSLWHRLLLDGYASQLLLSPTQEHTVWCAIIAADSVATRPANASLRPIDALAQTAAEAWSLLHTYRARRRLAAAVATADTRAFARWAAEFDRRANRAQYLTQAQLPKTLRAAVEAGQLVPATGLLLVGFDSKNPAQTALVEAIRAAGTPVEDLTPHPLFGYSVPERSKEEESPDFVHNETAGAPSSAVSPRSAGASNPNLTLVSAVDERAELAACARWLRVRLTEQPNAHLAVIVPSLEAARSEIDRIFRPILAPELDDLAAPTGSGPYEFSLGQPLARTPMVSTALDILRWASGSLPLDRVTSLLLSPHFSAGRPDEPDELLARAEFDAFVLRRQPLLQPEISLDALLALAAADPKYGAENLSLLTKHLRTLCNILQRRELARDERTRNGPNLTERTHTEWAAIIDELLNAAGWSTPGRDSSVEFQIRRKWLSSLDELTTLDFDSRSVGTRVSYSTVLAELTRIVSQTIFAPESRHAPIQILGPLESAGSCFDALWFLRASNLSWPAHSTPNPLLPWLLQRELAMPGADPAHDTAYARRITQRIAASAPSVVFSYAQQAGEGQQRPSPIVVGLAETILAEAGLTLKLLTTEEVAPVEAQPAPVALEAFSDDQPIPPPPDRIIEGGASVLAAQAACPFRAFAEKRLFASALDSPTLGLDAGQRGSLVHTVLDAFWKEVETQAALKLYTAEERDGILVHCVDAALARHSPTPGWSRAYLAVERERLLNLLGPWLDFEADQRAPFLVLAREQKLTDVAIGPLRLSVRVDRIDHTYAAPHLADDAPDAESTESAFEASEIILDYKTGPAAIADWLGPRPDAPQLPLYAVVRAAANEASATSQAAAPNLAAIAFASVRLGKDIGLNGYESIEGILPKPAKLKTASLAAQLDEWRATLTTLAENFHFGDAHVDPKQYPKTCLRCKQRLLCRLDPTTLNPVALDPAADLDSTDLDYVALEADRG
jgi:probable DNA repair protein